MGNSALIVVVASVLSGIMILLNIQRIDAESSVVQSYMEEEVLARELAHSGLSMVLADMYTDAGLSSDVNVSSPIVYQGGNIYVKRYENDLANQQIDFEVLGEYGDAQYLIHSRYRYEVDFPFAIYSEVPHLTLITDEQSTLYGGPNNERFYFGTSEVQRVEEQPGLGGLIDLGQIEADLNSALDNAWDGLPGEITQVEVLDSDNTFKDALPDIDPTQNNPWLEEFYFKTLDRIRPNDSESGDAFFSGFKEFGSANPEIPGSTHSFGQAGQTAILRVEGDMMVRNGSTVSGHGILLVEGDLTVEVGAALNWNGIVYVRPKTTQANVDLNGEVNINGAFVAYQEAIPPGSHMDVTTNRDLSGRWSQARGADTNHPGIPIPGPWFVHRHKWEYDWSTFPAVSPSRELFMRTGGAATAHEGFLRFNETLNNLASMGFSQVYIKFINTGLSGMGVFSMEVNTAQGPQTFNGSISAGFNGEERSPVFAPNALTDFGMQFRSVRMLQLMKDPAGTHPSDDGPHRVTDDFGRQGSFQVAIVDAATDRVLHTTSVYQHIREDENDDYEEEMDQLRQDIEAGNFGLTIEMGPQAAIRYDNIAAAGALDRTGFSAFAHVGTWTRRCNSSDHNCNLLTGLLVYWFTGLLVYFTGLLVYWFTGLLVYWFTGKENLSISQQVNKSTTTVPRLLLFALIVALQSCAPKLPPTYQAEPFRVMTYNIRYNNPGDGEHAWPHRRARVASTILFNRADLIGVQEALKDQLDSLSVLLPGYAWLGVGRDDGRQSGEYSAIFYREDRFEPIDSGTFWLSQTPSEPGSKDWDAAITRIVTWAHFRDLDADTSLFHFNTHFDHRGELAREKSAELIERSVTEMAGEYPVVLTGDFNFPPDAVGYATLTSSLTDALYASEEPHHGPEDTIYGGFEVTHEPGRRIDYIFTKNNVSVLQHATLSDNWEGAFASDHLAVISTLRVD